ncbi:myosin [Naegleria gruberi]|uniref:Myosin n=1 Tax=Naegleria gruberi TaxID=5762 RepID=D2V5C1_NAEGR|nr:myosin [Naegleria gruberi]EFC48085.1 myosin [Naegleria gruberi]|eukprot:XP_002680829.1 myosin [Naegleria gruberi]
MSSETTTPRRAKKSGGDNKSSFFQRLLEQQKSDQATSNKFKWVPDGEGGFVVGEIIEETASEVQFKLDDGRIDKCKPDMVYPMNPQKLDGIPDMAQLSLLNEPSVFYNLKYRYERDQIYTYSGLFLVAVNPYKNLPIYTDEVIKRHDGKRREDVEPHIYTVSDVAYRQMLQNGENQSMLITGESGAGKTVNTKRVIQYLTHVAGKGGSGGQIEQQLIMCNPLLESFGNAKTLRNDNSSRFGKFIEIQFDKQGYIGGCRIQHYLLETTRVIRQALNERSFHIFYQIFSLDSDKKKELYLTEPSDFEYINQSNCYVVPGVDDTNDLKLTLQSMKVMKMSDSEIDMIFRIVSFILHIGNVQFKDNEEEHAQIVSNVKSGSPLDFACDILSVPSDQLTKGFCKPRIILPGEIIEMAVDSRKANFNRNALVMSTYLRMFDWIVQKINQSMNAKCEIKNFIGVLDIAGFEIFELNSFEQMCINFTNEKLQQFFNHHMFKKEQEEYLREDIAWNFIDFGLDLQPTIDLIEKPQGVLDILHQKCVVQNQDEESFVRDLLSKNQKSEKLRKDKFDQKSFIVTHYAGEVKYNVRDWYSKNVDPLNDDCKMAMQKSQLPFIKKLFVDQQSSGGSGAGVRFQTVGNKYKKQLSDLIQLLSSTEPHFIRCIKPNNLQKPGIIQAPSVLEQLKCNGVLEGIRISRKGYPGRIKFNEFVKRYELLAKDKKSLDGMKLEREKCHAIISKITSLDDSKYKLGKTKIFLKSGVEAQLEELREAEIEKVIALAQAACQGHSARKQYKKLMGRIVYIKLLQRNFRAYLSMKDWDWYQLFVKVRPLVEADRSDKILQQMKDEIEKLKQEIANQIENNKITEQEKDNLNRNVEQIRSEMAIRESEIEQLQQMMRDMKDKIQNRESEMENLNGSLKDGESAMNNLRRDLQNKDFEMNQLKTQLDQAKRQLSDKDVEVLQRGKSVQEMKEELERALNELEDVKTELNITKNTLNSSDYSLDQTRQEMIDKERKLRERDNEIIDYKRKVQDMEQDLRKNEIDKNELELQSNSMKKQLDTFQQELDKKTREFDQLRKQKLTNDQQSEQLFGELEEEKRKRNDLEKKSRELAQQLDTERFDKERIESQSKDLSNEIDELKREIASLKLRISELEDLNERLKRENQAYERDLSDLRLKSENELNKLQSELQREKQRTQDEISNLSQKLEDTRKRMEETESKLNSSDRDVRNLKKDKTQLEHDKSDLELKVKRLESEVKSSNTDQDNTKQQLQESENRKRELMNRIRDVELELNNSKEELSREKSKSSTQSSELNQNRDRLTQLESDLTQLDLLKSKLEKQVRDQQYDLDQEKNQTQKLRSDLEFLRRSETEYKSKSEVLESTLAQREQELKNLRDQLEQLRSQLSDNSNISEEAQKQIKKMKDDLKKQLEQLQESEQRFKDENQKHKQTQQVIADRENQLNLSKDENQRLLREISQLRSDLENVRTNLSSNDSETLKLKSELRERDRKYKDLESEKDEFESQVDKLERDVLEWKSKADQKDQSISQIESENKQLQSDAAKAQQDLDRTKQDKEREVSTMKQRLDQLQRGDGSSSSTVSSAEISRLRREYDSELIKLKAQLEDQVIQLADTEQKRKLTEFELNDFRDKYNQEVKSKKKIESVKLSLETEIEDLRDLAEKAEDLQDELSSVKQQHNEILSELQSELKKERSERIYNEEEANRWKRDVQNLKVQLELANQKKDEESRRVRAQYEQELQDLQDLYNKLKNDKKKFSKSSNSLESELRDAQRSLSDSERYRTLAEQKADRLERELKMSVLRLETESSNQLLIAQEKSRIESQLQSTRDQVDDLESENTKLKSDLDSERRKFQQLMRRLNNSASTSSVRGGASYGDSDSDEEDDE